jgi:hypothetical protein
LLIKGAVLGITQARGRLLDCASVLPSWPESFPHLARPAQLLMHNVEFSNKLAAPPPPPRLSLPLPRPPRLSLPSPPTVTLPPPPPTLSLPPPPTVKLPPSEVRGRRQAQAKHLWCSCLPWQGSVPQNRTSSELQPAGGQGLSRRHAETGVVQGTFKNLLA